MFLCLSGSLNVIDLLSACSTVSFVCAPLFDHIFLKCSYTYHKYLYMEDACGGSSPHPHTTCRSCVSIWKIAAMISAVNSTCRAEAEAAAAEDDAEAEAEAGRVHGGNHCRQFSDRCAEANTV